ncbi:receptor-type tyrosine-protein phosphatase S-like isoform X6 [Salvelinus fontinalis]|uniref:receptor-type tyrosine-protein phosphatase S-like isoform X6 n=1 Tax=Salvelinus fontinalis TaxID=8038 RepID=UPI002486B58C|nr:receptor-type tyrosine-protein phosphatase S-like isoform X6 [Salvelinus fontinalis]
MVPPSPGGTVAQSRVPRPGYGLCLYPPFLLPLLLVLTSLPNLSDALAAPKFTKIPGDQIGVSGGVASFVCQASGDPKPMVNWNKKGKKVNSQRIETIEFDDGAGAVLRIQPLRAPRDENVYECVARNSEGEVATTAKLAIIREDLLPFGFPSIDMGPQLKVVERTRTATMLCAASGIPDPEISWFKDFLPVEPRSSLGRIKQLRSGALQIENSEETDQGKYECVATNSQGVRYSSPANLYVRELREGSTDKLRRVPPRFSILPANHEIMPGGSVNITCVAVGSPMPYVKWMLGIEDLTPEDEMPVGRNVLELNGVRESANYTCVAMSSLGIIEATAQVSVKTLPKPPGTPIVTETTATSVTITWDSGNPDPVSYYIIQYRAKTPDSKYEAVDGITTTRYSIGGLYPNTEYEVRVSAFNSIGQGPSSTRVEARTGEQAPASPPRNVQARIISQNTVMVRWEEPEEPNGQVKGYRVYYTMDPSQPMSLWQIHNVQDSTITTIQSLVPSETYTVRVLAFTSVGDGPFSDSVHVKVLPGVPGQPGKFKVGKVTDTSIQLTWEPSYTKEGIVNYELLYKPVKFGSLEKLTFGPRASYTVEGLRANTEYSFSLAAISNKGIGAFTNELVQRTSQAKPSAAPLGVSCDSPRSTSLRVSWKPPPTETQNGVLTGYELRYQQVVSGARVEGQGPEVKGPPIPPEQGQVVLEGLEKWTWYRVILAAFTTEGSGPESPALLCRTDDDVPGAAPRQVEVQPFNSTALRVTWRSVLARQRQGQIRGYQVHYAHVESGSSRTLPRIKDLLLDDSQFVEDDFTEYEMIVGGLKPETSYSVSVAAYTTKGDGTHSKARVVQTLGIVPGAPSLSVRPGSESSVVVRWGPPSRGSDSGPGAKGSEIQIQGYRLQFGLKNATLDTMVEFSSRERTYTLTDVIPDVPRNFSVNLATKTSVLLTWEFPDSPYPYHFTVEYNHQKIEVDARLRKTVIPNLQPDTDYDFKITSPEGNMGRLRHRILAKTSPLIGIRRPEIDHTRDTETTITIILPSLENRSPVKNVYVVVVPLRRARGVIRHLKNPDEMDLEELLDISQRQRDSRQQKQVDLRRAYITARFTPDTLPAFFTLGDQLDYGGFENRALEPGQEYVFFILAELNGTTGKMYGASPYTDPVIAPDSDPQPLDAGDGLIWVVGPVLAVVFIICIVIAILLYKNSKPDSKRKESEPGTKSLLGNAEMMAHHPTDPVEMRRINFQTPGMMSHPPIPITELAEHTELLKANDNLRLSQEYESIDPGQQFTWEHSNLEVNKPKNRYANVIAYDHTRVVLAPIEGSSPGILGSDYINANYIDGYRKQNAYIATQGPLAETFGDFWRMVWEQRAASVVMMTRLEEKSRVKCDQYWPTRGSETYGMTQVTLLDTMELATFCVRTFSLHKSGSSERREVRQFQFTAWPDHGVPEYPTPFLAFLRRVKACNPPDAGPVIAHCSAGVGRTGCFIVIDAMLERIRHERTADVYGHVTLMRSQRNYMVQTEDQYGFIHEALLEAVACGNTEVAARSLFSYMQKLGQVENGEHVTGMELEFKRLANTKAHTSRFVSANLPCNKFKNRLVNIMPYETTRVCLQPIRGLEGSDYINASYIDGYRQQRGYIATQGPLAETTEDFWRMLWEHNSTIVVMLTKLREMGREKCHQYWPAERSARYQYFVVDPMAEYNMPQYILREFKVTDARDGQSRTVRQFQFTDWPEQGVPKSGEGFIDFIGQVHKTKEQFGQDGPISVHCSAGVGRTGVFITLSIVLERMRYEGAVDIFQTVKMLRTQRPAMVQTEDEYQFSYQAALEYLGSFDHYAT